MLESRPMLGLFVLVLIGSVLSTRPVLAQPVGSFATTGQMTTGRWLHTATLLKDGRVLIAGGANSSFARELVIYGTAELYDPSTRTFAATGDLTIPRARHSATLLNDGRVLITGGSGGATAELYDPATGKFTATGEMIATRFMPTATKLNNGNVLIVSEEKFDTLPTAEIYDSVTGTFTAVGVASGRGQFANATLLYDGTVLIAGGREDSPVASLYNPDTGAFQSLGSLAWPGPLTSETTTLLANGQVLIAGGSDDPYGFDAVASVQLYDPQLGTFRAGKTSLLTARTAHSATLLRGGLVLFAGGNDGNYTLGSTELYDPATEIFVSGGQLANQRYLHTATLLRDGTVLFAGGLNDSGRGLSLAELYVPAPIPSTPECGKYTPMNGTCRRMAVFPWYAAKRGEWETDIRLATGLADSARLGYAPALALFSYDGNLEIVDSRGDFVANEVDGLELEAGASYMARILGGVTCSPCRPDPFMATGSLLVFADAPVPSALDGVHAQATLYWLAAGGSSVTETPIFEDQASSRWTSAFIDTPQSQQSQPGSTVTAFAVVNLSSSAQAVRVKIVDEFGNVVASARTPSLKGAPDLFFSSGKLALHGVGEVFADTVAHLLGEDLFPSVGGADFHGTLVLEGEGGEKIAPSIFRFNGRSITSVVAQPN